MGLDRTWAREERLYWDGRLHDSYAACGQGLARPDLSDDDRVDGLILQGMAAFDSGDVTDSLRLLRDAHATCGSSRSLQFRARIALFSRASQYESPDSVVTLLSEVRQLAHAEGTAYSLGSLHLVVARLEAIRGFCISARHHMELSRHLLAAAPPAVRSSICQVDSGFEMYAGNLRRARESAWEGLKLSHSHGLTPIYAGCMTNLGSIFVYLGKNDKARELLERAVGTCSELPMIRFSATDALMQVALLDGRLEDALDLQLECESAITSLSLPSRSWYDLAHQVNRCAYHEVLEDWDAIVAIADDAGQEAESREYRAVQTALLCAKARALAHIGKVGEAGQLLQRAVRTCPRGAVDPLIVLEASRGLCASLADTAAAGATHFDRARAAARAIGHRYHEHWIEQLSQRAAAGVQVTVPPKPPVSMTDAALMLTDVATVLGAGHSVDLMAHRVVSLLEGTPLRSRVAVSGRSGCDYQPNPTATWKVDGDGNALIQVRGSDRCIDVRIARITTIDEFTIVKSIGDLVQAAAGRAGDAQDDHNEDHLWPLSSTIPADDGFVFRSPRMIELLDVARRLARAPLSVLIVGETGTGKDVFARLMHAQGPAKKGPFVPFNCATVPRDLVESQLFGYRRGAFTGATESFGGLIRSADGGTLFLDEIGDLDLATQPKLLRFLETGEIQPLGEPRPHVVTTRLVSATNVNLAALVREGKFRQDLLYRVAGSVLALPPLRERKDEIPALAAHFLARYSAECSRVGVRLADDFVAALLLYDWPGNIRELANEVRRAVALADDGTVLGASTLAPAIQRTWQARPAMVPVTTEPSPAVNVKLGQTLAQAFDELERKFIDHALESTGGRVREAAQLLGLSRKGLFLKRRRRGMITTQAAAQQS
jgi:DNA-binding NtrC family response regulator/tetratricopeptide (TPR) repeat protein